MAAMRIWSMQMRAFAAAVVLVLAAGWCAVSSPALAWADVSGTEPMYRMYNPYTGEHFYTANASERDSIVAEGWAFEGVGWFAPLAGSPVFRLYNPYAGEHHYTLDSRERDSLLTAGWTDEGIGWFSDADGSVALYRQYNPFAFSCNHNYTLSVGERDQLVALGWRDEGVAWYGVHVDDGGIGRYHDASDDPGGVAVNVYASDGAEVMFDFGHLGANGGPIYESGLVTASLEGGNGSFIWEDNWNNGGRGTIALDGDDLVLTIRYDEEADFNRYEWPSEIVCSKASAFPLKITGAEDAIAYAKSYRASNGLLVPPIIDVEEEAGGVYLLHGYSIVSDSELSHTATSFWWQVTASGRIYDYLVNTWVNYTWREPLRAPNRWS